MGLDVQNTRENTNLDMTNFWFVILMSSLFYICTFLPMGLFYAESDEGKAFVRKTAYSLGLPILLRVQKRGHLLVHCVYCTFQYLWGVQVHVHSDKDSDMRLGKQHSIPRSYVRPCCCVCASVIKQHQLLYSGVYTQSAGWVSDLRDHSDDPDRLVFPVLLYAYRYVGLRL